MLGGSPVPFRVAYIKLILAVTPIWPNDHEPPHVHVVKADGTARLALGDGVTWPRLLTVVGMSRCDAANALRLVARHQELCLRRWNEIHG
jgi:hypothetical protein